MSGTASPSGTGMSRRNRRTLILLANSEALRWPTRLDEAAIERSPYAMAFLEALVTRPAQ